VSCLFYADIEVNKVYERSVCRGNTLKFYNFTIHKVYSDVAGRKAGDSIGVTAEENLGEKKRTRAYPKP